MTKNDLRVRILSLAGFSPSELSAPVTEALPVDKGVLKKVHDILLTLEEVWVRKTLRYGGHRYHRPPDLPMSYQSSMAFADIDRKFNRLRHMQWDHGVATSPDLLLETMSDLAVATVIAMVVQLVQEEEFKANDLTRVKGEEDDVSREGFDHGY